MVLRDVVYWITLHEKFSLVLLYMHIFQLVDCKFQRELAIQYHHPKPHLYAYSLRNLRSFHLLPQWIARRNLAHFLCNPCKIVLSNRNWVDFRRKSGQKWTGTSSCHRPQFVWYAFPLLIGLFWTRFLNLLSSTHAW